MRYVDVFHGDADGLCALHQLRLAEPLPAGAQSQLVTGLKRQIGLLAAVTGGPDCEVTVLDISLDRNRAALERVLVQGATVRYFDHHFAGTVPAHPRLHAVIDQAPDVCASILIDRYIGGRHRSWAVVGAFGDNLSAAARSLAKPLGLSDGELGSLHLLGEALNYNAYGDTVADVMIEPVDLYAALHRHTDPVDFAATPLVRQLLACRSADLASALAQKPVLSDPQGAVFRLPDMPWSRRVIGTFANALARANPQRAHAVLKDNPDATFTVSVRAPIATPHGADRLCRRYETGGGRAAAAGIERLDPSGLDAFIQAFRAERWEK
jgi:hypothetical protein